MRWLRSDTIARTGSPAARDWTDSTARTVRAPAALAPSGASTAPSADAMRSAGPRQICRFFAFTREEDVMRAPELRRPARHVSRIVTRSGQNCQLPGCGLVPHRPQGARSRATHAGLASPHNRPEAAGRNAQRATLDRYASQAPQNRLAK